MTENKGLCEECKHNLAETLCIFCSRRLCKSCGQTALKIEIGSILGKTFKGLACKACMLGLDRFSCADKSQIDAFKQGIMKLVEKHICLSNLSEGEK